MHAPTDRVLVVGYYTDVPAFAERLFAGGRPTFVVGFYADDRYMRETIASSIAIRAHRARRRRSGLLRSSICLGDYLHARYDHVGEVSSSEGPLRSSSVADAVEPRRARTGCRALDES